jgi:hypothetical protein
VNGPIEDIEQDQAMHDLGRTAVKLYRGATSESDSRRDAFWATVAALVAMLNPPAKDEA